MKHYTTFVGSCSFTIMFLFAGLSTAATKYVSNTGNNNQSGNSWSQAWLTLQYAVDHIFAGDTLWIADGTYTGFNMSNSGSPGNPIVIIAAGDNATINLPCNTTDGINVEEADHIEINGVRVVDQPRNGIRLVNAHFCIVRNTYCENNFERGIFTGFTNDILIEYNECLESIDEHGIYVSNSSDRSIIRYNICHHNNRGGIQINADESQGGDGISTDPQIYGNILYENGVAGGAAINLDGVQSALIYNNLLYQNHATGIALFQQDGAEPSINAEIAHNTIINASDARWCILAVNGSHGAKIYNNILINQHPWRGSIAIDPDAVLNFDSDYNILVNSLSRMGDGSSVPLTTWQGYGYDENSMLADPLAEIFIMPGTDYHLKEGSQAIDAGNGAFAFGITTDIESTFRPQGSQHDQGAYEFSGALSIGEKETKPSLPSKDTPHINISWDHVSWTEDHGLLQLFNQEGKLIASNDMSSPGSISFSHLLPGMYAIMVSDQHEVQWSKLFVWIGSR